MRSLLAVAFILVAHTACAQISGGGGGGFNISAAQALNTLPLSGVETSVVDNENKPLAPDASIDILNISPGTPGVVTSIWTTISSLNPSMDDILSVYVDGEGTPSVTTDLGSLGSINAWKAGFSFRAHTPHLTIDYNAQAPAFSYNFKFPIPFKSSIHITLTGKGTAANVYTSATYSLGQTIPWKMMSAGLTYANRLIAETQEQINGGAVIMLNLPAGSSGYVAYHGLFYDNASPSIVEVNPCAYLDGLVPNGTNVPQYNASGTEDYFRSGWSAGAGKGDNDSAIFTTPGDTNNFTSWSAGLDFLALHGGLKFNNGIIMKLEQGLQGGAPVVGPSDINWLILYYIPN